MAFPPVGERKPGRKPGPKGGGRSGGGLLKAMRHVLNNSEMMDRSAQEKAARQWYLDTPDKFLLKLHDLEGEYRDRYDAKKKETSGPDLGHDEAVKVLTRLLREANKFANGE